jgi:RNA polymerase sigma factor (TIGR02999 family)
VALTRDQTIEYIIGAAESSDALAEERMAPVYAELRAVAGAIMRGQHAHTLQPTALVNEAWLKIADKKDWESTAHFIAVAAKAMRQCLIDHARAKAAAKRGGGAQRVDTPAIAEASSSGAIEELEITLRDLETHDPRAARVVELKFFGGLSNDDIAALLDISRTTVAADWKHARAWLRREISARRSH